MKINRKNLNKFLMIFILFPMFIPEGMSTIGVADYTVNASFLDNIVVMSIVKFLYYERNVLGIVFTGIFLLKRIKQVFSGQIQIKATDAVILFAGWIIVSSVYNHSEVWGAFIQTVSSLGAFFLVKECLKNDQTSFIQSMSTVVTIMFLLNAFFSILYPMGITTGHDYLHTPYFFLGLKNQITPMLLLASSLYFTEQRVHKSRMSLWMKQGLIILNALIMDSKTGIVCVFFIIALNTFLSLEKTTIFKHHTRKSRQMFYVYIAIALMIGIVFFDVLPRFSWLINDILHKDITLSGRTELWNEAFELIRMKPIAGYGFGTIIRPGLYSHNLIVELLVITGIIGLFLYALCIKLIFQESSISRMKNELSVPLLSLVTGLILSNITEAFIFNIPTWIALGLVAYMNCETIVWKESEL